MNDRKDYFGRIDGNKCKLNEYGKTIEQIFKKIPVQYPYISIDYRVIMPDYLHAIIIINRSENTSVVKSRDLSLDKKRKIKSLSEIIGAFKTMSSKELHKKGLKEFKW